MSYNLAQRRLDRAAAAHAAAFDAEAKISNLRSGLFSYTSDLHHERDKQRHEKAGDLFFRQHMIRKELSLPLGEIGGDDW